jgi:Preprotein translocase subunit SecA (ATPase, RNA helicase)
MTSYDVTNLCANIPIKETIELIKTRLNTNTEEHAYTEQLTKTMETIMNQNYFRFKNKIHKQEDGIPMGSPTSKILSEIFL